MQIITFTVALFQTDNQYEYFNVQITFTYKNTKKLLVFTKNIIYTGLVKKNILNDRMKMAY